MAQETEVKETSEKKSSRIGLVLGMVVAILGGGGAFYAVYSGFILSGKVPESAEAKPPVATPLSDVVFVKINPLIISLPAGGESKHVRFGAQLEVNATYEKEVEAIMPRIVDVLNSYLRAVEPADFDQPAALTRLRTQLLRRVQVVTGEGRVRDFLIMEFVLT